jgi:hypothetical protein
MVAGGYTIPADMIISSTDEGNPAATAQGRIYQRQSFTAGRTDMQRTGVGDERATDVTKRRKEKIKDCMQEWLCIHTLSQYPYYFTKKEHKTEALHSFPYA